MLEEGRIDRRHGKAPDIRFERLAERHQEPLATMRFRRYDVADSIAFCIHYIIQRRCFLPFYQHT
jgi:hypothetical protein